MRLVLLFFLIFTSCATSAQTGKVVSVKDGDTIEMMINGKAVRIRLFGVDAPEKGQPFGDKARQYCAELCFNKTVRMVKKNKDQYGRIVAEVYLPDGSSLNHRLVSAGFAWHYTQFSNSRELARAQEKAKLEKSGLWADKSPIAPWNWRKQHRRMAR
ncbi:thermonuclease family protein [Chitinophaga sp.]|uniref:thermonuclease family protein n=1 Tax=Chitinophaga sp. TaxID=1869181 RepID=UPI002631AD28|nr:thermonuclease family protein [uncultured Chitinophaga sp.]